MPAGPESVRGMDLTIAEKAVKLGTMIKKLNRLARFL
jgi:hypothetical protein